MPDNRNNIVDGPPRWRWPWQRAEDLDIGVRRGAAFGDSTVDRPADRTPPLRRLRIPRPGRLYGSTAAVPAWKRLPVQAVILAALAFHLLGPGAVLLAGDGARGFLLFIDTVMPNVAGFDVSRWLIPGAAAWMWQPAVAVGGAALLRLTALNVAGRDPLGAIWIAGAAAAIDTATWLFVGLKLWGTAFTAEEGHALVTLLKLEGGALLVLFFILAPLGRRRLGQTDADWNGDN